MSVARLCAIRLAWATSAYRSACQSCGSICVVSGFHTNPRLSTKARESAGQSASGTATTWAPKVPVAPLSLPRYSAPWTRRICRDSRAAKTAISLPTVVGVAVCPCVWESMGRPAC